MNSLRYKVNMKLLLNGMFYNQNGCATHKEFCLAKKRRKEKQITRITKKLLRNKKNGKPNRLAVFFIINQLLLILSQS